MPRGFYERTPHGEPGAIDEALVVWLDRWVGAWARAWFRPELEGVEHLPKEGAYVLAANHSGGGGVDVVCFAMLWWKHFKLTRPIAGFAHPIAFRLPLFGRIAPRLGVVPSTYAAADRALVRGVPLLVFPGGDHEGFRPFWQARRVDFAGRKGFLRIARKHGVAVVPLAITGTHVTVPILWRSRALAWALVWPRLAGVKRVPVTLVGAFACALAYLGGAAAGGAALGALLAWASWTLVPAQFIALVPSRVRLRVLPAVPPEALADEDAAYARVTEALQAALLE